MKPPKRPRKASTKSRKVVWEPNKTCQKHVTKVDQPRHALSVLRRTISNLRQMTEVLKTGKKVNDYEVLAGQLSAIAGLNNGHVWGWRYIASVLSGSIIPSKKFIDAVSLHNEKINTHKKQYFYFVRRKSFIMVYEKSCLREIVKAHMKQRNYKLVPFKRYMQVKRNARTEIRKERQ